jgi:uncharacterized membrane protein
MTIRRARRSALLPVDAPGHGTACAQPARPLGSSECSACRDANGHRIEAGRSFLSAMTTGQRLRTPSPVVVAHLESRAADVQLRIADAITAFAGSMTFVYIHAVAFAVWMLFIESNPWPKLTLIVSLEAIFLSTFVMIGQNRQASFQQAKADHDFQEQEQELKRNTQVTQAIHVLAKEIHSQLVADEHND